MSKCEGKQVRKHGARNRINARYARMREVVREVFAPKEIQPIRCAHATVSGVWITR